MASVNEILEEALLKAHKLPKWKVDPMEVWTRISILSGETLKHSRDTYFVDTFILDKVADYYISKAKKDSAVKGFVLGAPGGGIGVALNIVDVGEYIRILYNLAQQLGYVYGILPNPLDDYCDVTADDYMDFIAEDILKIMALGLGVGGVSLAVNKLAQKIAEKEAKEVLRKKISDKVLTKIVKKIAEVLGVKVTKETISKGVLKVIPVFGGAISAALNYKGIGKLGISMKESLKKEREKYKKYMLRKKILPPENMDIKIEEERSDGSNQEEK